MRTARSGSRRNATAIKAPNRTLVSRKAATIAIGASVIAQIAMPYEPVEYTAAAHRQERDAATEQQNAGPGDGADLLADQERAAGCGEERRRSARERVDLPHVAGAIALDQAGEIEEMDQHRGDDEG